jgi:hypothetical protein
MEIKLPWIERLLEMGVKECLPLEDTPAATIYSAVHYHKKEIKKRGMRFKVQEDDGTGMLYVCRIK